MSRTKHRKPGEQRSSKIPAILIGLLIIAVIVGALCAKPLRNLYRAVSAQSIVKEATALNEQGRPAEAFELAREAFQKSPEHPEVMRLLGTMMKDNPSSRDSAKYFLKELNRRGEATLDDKINLAGIYYAEGEESEARVLLDEVESADAANASAIAFRTRLEGGSTSANTPAEKLITTEDTEGMDNLEKLAIAKAQVSGRSAEGRTNGVEILWELTENTDRAALEAMEILARLTTPLPDKAKELQAKLEAHPDSKDKQYLIGKSLEIRSDPTRSEQIIAEAVKARLGKPISELYDFLDWLLIERQSGWILDLIPEETAKKSPRTLGYHMEALARENQWQKLDLLLLDRELPIQDAQRTLLQARCAAALDKPSEEIRSHLKTTIGASSQAGDFNSVAQATQLAQSNNFEEVTRLGLSVLVTSPVWKEQALRGYYSLAAEDGDSAKMLESAEDLLAENPNNEQFQQSAAYLHLLEGTEIERSYATIMRLAGMTSERPDRALLLSLAYLRLGRLEEAAEICKSIDPIDLRPGSRAVYANILNRSGDSIEAFKIAKKIPTRLLIDSEVNMVSWLR